MATVASANSAAAPRERKQSTSAPIAAFQEPVAPPGISKPKHKRTVTGFGPEEIKSVQASVPEPQRDAWVSMILTNGFCGVLTFACTDGGSM